MQLLGVEFSNFACFNQQYVPIMPGMNVLVGRNNVGKTALLRGLSTLGALPIGLSVRGMPTNLTGYFPNQAGAEFAIITRIHPTNSFFFSPPEAWWQKAVAEGFAKWRFRIGPDNTVYFLQCNYTVPAPEGGEPRNVSVMETAGGAAVIKEMHFPDLVVTRNIALTQRSFNTNAGPSPIFDMGNPITAALEVGDVKLISPHRVVSPSGGPMQTVLDLPSDATNLAQFLQTLYGRERDAFVQIEQFVTSAFPEFKHVNPVSSGNNQVSIDLTESKNNRRIPLANCGTGVEQLLTLATFVLTTTKPGIILLDEPHSYLHPSAERELVRFLQANSDHRYVIATHSAVLMNSVEPDRVTYVSPPGHAYPPPREHAGASRILFDLGYRNSDSLFHDQLVPVEGKSDKEILPILLLKDGEIDETQINRTGFPILEGVDKGTLKLQTSILKFEKLLSAIGRGDQPRIYLFDGDRKADDKHILSGTNSPATGENISAKFLPRREIENYLLESEAIASALQEELRLNGLNTPVTSDEVKQQMQALLRTDDPKLFPDGRKEGEEAFKAVKGSVLLEKIYDQYRIPYHKERSGVLIAKHISPKNQPAISELTELVKPLFSRMREGSHS